MGGQWHGMRQFDSYFDQLIGEGLSACFSVGLLKEGKVIYQYARGLTQDGGEPIHVGTQFNIGSVSKTITGALIVKLLEQGQISLLDKVGRYIPEYKHSDVTIYHLMTHTAGYSISSGPDWPGPGALTKYMNSVYEMEVIRPPGLEAAYFTYGYAILMDILQRISGESIEEFARTHLFDPLGMEDTTYDMTTLQPGRYTLPCGLGDQRWDMNLDQLAATADSSVYSTAMDMLEFSTLFLDRGTWNGARVFAKTSVDLMMRECTEGRFAKTPIFWMKTEADGYFCFGDLNSPSTVGHPGFSGCMLFIDPVYRTAGVILTNSQRLHSDFLNYNKIINLLMSV
ncbi:MAG: serine hydrolase domain-containing protein [Bacilli bacterium]